MPFTPEEMIPDPLTTDDDEIQDPAFIGGFLSLVQWALNLALQPLRCRWYWYLMSHTGRGSSGTCFLPSVLVAPQGQFGSKIVPSPSLAVLDQSSPLNVKFQVPGHLSS